VTGLGWGGGSEGGKGEAGEGRVRKGKGVLIEPVVALMLLPLMNEGDLQLQIPVVLLPSLGREAAIDLNLSLLSLSLLSLSLYLSISSSYLEGLLEEEEGLVPVGGGRKGTLV